ncbi:hypothetical protein [Herbaspirillum sp. NPDC101396]|uniref:hypothetical protein n=1 Tax=Herbaspirillum sp. NPDC101396 TaxID=3364005 RepID=UPI00383B1E15
MDDNKTSEATGAVSLRAYARHREVALSAVQKAIRSGRIQTTAAGKIDVAAADAAWAANTDVSRLPPDSPRAPHSVGATGNSSPQSDDDEPVPGGGTSEYQTHRANRERIRAEREQIELDQIAGRSMDVGEAGRLAFTAFRTLRDAMMNVAPRIKDNLAAESDPMKCELLVEQEIIAALASIDIARVLNEQDEEVQEDGSD